MPKPPTFTDDEIAALALTLKALWRPGSQIAPWLRRNANRLYRLIQEEGRSWAAVAAAMTAAGITYRTGHPWRDRVLSREVARARVPLKGRLRAAVAAPPPTASPVQAGSNRPLPSAAQALPGAPSPIPAVSSPPAPQFPAPVNAPPPDPSVGVTRKQYVFEPFTLRPAPQSLEEAQARSEERFASFRKPEG